VAIAGLIGIPTDADNAVDSTNIAANADGSVYERLEDLLDDTTAILLDTDTGVALGTDAITSTVMATGSVDAAAIADNAIDEGAIASNSITSDEIAANAIGASELAADAVVEITTSVTQESNHGTVYYVDAGSADDTGDGLTWATAKKTIQAAVTLARDYTVIYCRTADAAFSEDVETNPSYDNIRLIGVSTSQRQPRWSPTAANNAALYVNSRNFTLDNFSIQAAANTGALVEVDEVDPNNGIGVTIQNCTFLGNGSAHSAIVLIGGIVEAEILNNEFYGFYGMAHGSSGNNYEATIWGQTYTQSAVSVDVIGNTFFDCLDGIRLQAVACLIKDNVFADTGFSSGMTTVIDTTASGSSSGGNIVTGNVFENKTYEINNANGYYSCTTDNWSGNICTDGLTTETYPGAGTALIEYNNVVPKTYLCSEVTSVMTTTDYGTADSPVDIFTVTGDIMCRAYATCETNCTSASNLATLELGIASSTAILLKQDIVDNTAFKAGDVWTMTTGADNDYVLALPTEWYYIGGGADIILTIADQDMASGQIRFNLEWIPMSPDAQVVGAAP